MLRRKFFEQPVGLRGERERDPAAIGPVALAPHEARILQAVDQLDRGLRLQQKLPGDILRWRTEPDVHSETLFDRHSDDSPVVGHADETVARLADRMAAEDIGRVPIVERSTMRLVGLVSRKDLLRIRRDSRAAEETRRSYFGKALAAEEESRAGTQVVSAGD